MDKTILSYCIPVFENSRDLRKTLKTNLLRNANLKNSIEFIVACFDPVDTISTWINKNFHNEIKNRTLKYHHIESAPTQTHGKRINSFKHLLNGKIFSFLDPKSLTDETNSKSIIEIFTEHNFNCILHQFSGKWNDNSCTRISINTKDFVEIGFDETLPSEEWTEVDTILSILVQHPSRIYLHSANGDITTKSEPLKRFLFENNLHIKKNLHNAPNPRRLIFSRSGQRRTTKYASSCDNYRRFNQLCSFFKNTMSAALRDGYNRELVYLLRNLCENTPAKSLYRQFLHPQFDQEPTISRNDIVLVSCIKNETQLERWISFYRKLGVTHFFIIDDHSEKGISTQINGKDLFTWTPKCGRFRFAKAFWIELLLRMHAVGNWAVTVDSDEYLEILDNATTNQENNTTSKLRGFLLLAEKNGIEYFPGFLLDLIPAPNYREKIAADEQLTIDQFSHYEYSKITPPALYLNHNTVTWSYGRSSSWAFKIDCRNRLNQAFDSLRKFPLFKMNEGIHLNQGFHDLIINKTSRDTSEMERADLLTILHYKLYSSQIDAQATHTRPTSAYHQETQLNIERLRRNLKAILIESTESRFSYRYISPFFVPTPFRQTIAISNPSPSPSVKRPDEVIGKHLTLEFRKSPGQVYANGLAIYGPSFDDAINWVMGNTPFDELFSCSSNYAVLSSAKFSGMH